MNFFQLPIGAGRNDPVIGEMDGAQIRMAPDGTRYYEQYQPPARQAIVEALTTTLDDQGRAVHDRAPQAPVAGKAVIDALVGGAMQGLTAPGRALQGEPVTYGDAWTTALDYGVLSAPTSAPEGALRGGGIRAYHGSPHDFDRFSMDKIGTGEGAQAYGHGLYFAESEDVARSYRDALSGAQPFDLKAVSPRAYELMDFDITNFAGSATPDVINQEAANFITRGGAPSSWMNDETVAALRAADLPPANSGHMYEVRINANPDDFLDWDAPLSEQPEAARNAIQDVLGLPTRKPDAVVELPDGRFGLSSGGQPFGRADGWPDRGTAEYVMNAFLEDAPADRQLSRVMSRFPSPAQKSEDLARAGIPGIKYYDGMSRGAEGGTRNFVVFDENLIEIVRKYGIAGAAAYLGMPEDEVRQAVGGS